jgi:hypothetical protein
MTVRPRGNLGAIGDSGKGVFRARRRPRPLHVKGSKTAGLKCVGKNRSTEESAREGMKNG